MKEISFAQAIRDAIAEEMRRDDKVFLMGEDIAQYGGAFKVTRDIAKEFGSDRVRNTPISEGGFVGVAIGASLLGARPIVEIMFMDFILLAIDQIVNQAAKFHYVYGEQAKVPIVIRTPGGGGRSYGPTHSQSLEAHFMHTPGIKIAAPSTPADAKGLLKTAVRDDNPVLFLESKVLYPVKGNVSDGEHLVPFGRAEIVSEGDDVTIIAYSRMVHEALKAAEMLAGRDVTAEVIDLRTLAPLDEGTIIESVKRTGKVVIVEEGTRTAGVAAEIGFRIFEQIYDYLEAPIRRVTCPDIPVPCSPVLEKAALPNAERIAADVLRIFD
ncbi:MAG: alpha-ketoacid dehydrogenase subunit beta [Planctomycetota bacterium]